MPTDWLDAEKPALATLFDRGETNGWNCWNPRLTVYGLEFTFQDKIWEKPSIQI